MGLKFLNKKGWHTGSLRNIENVWKAEQKNDAELRKLDELRKQIHEEREKDEFRLLQEQAGFTPRQERLEFLYDSGLSVGKTISEGFKELETHPSEKEKGPSESTPSSSSSQQPTVPGALFEYKPQSANDAWRKLHSDPLLMIRQREREAMARIQNNPVKMAMIRKSMETKKKDDEVEDGERQKTNLKQKRRFSSKHHTESEDDSHVGEENKKKEKHKRKERVDNIDEESRDQTRHHRRSRRDSESEDQRNSNSLRPNEDRNEEDLRGERTRHHRHSHNDRDGEKQRHGSPLRQKINRNEDELQARNHRHAHIDHREGEKRRHGSPSREKADRREDEGSKKRYDNSSLPPRPESHKRKGKATQLSKEERAAKLREMEIDAEIHEEQRWKRLERAKEDDAREDRRSGNAKGSSFLDSMQKSVYGADKGGSSTIEESLRRRTHFRQGRSEADERNAFRR